MALRCGGLAGQLAPSQAWQVAWQVARGTNWGARVSKRPVKGDGVQLLGFMKRDLSQHPRYLAVSPFRLFTCRFQTGASVEASKMINLEAESMHVMDLGRSPRPISLSTHAGEQTTRQVVFEAIGTSLIKMMTISEISGFVTVHLIRIQNRWIL